MIPSPTLRVLKLPRPDCSGPWSLSNTRTLASQIKERWSDFTLSAAISIDTRKLESKNLRYAEMYIRAVDRHVVDYAYKRGPRAFHTSIILPPDLPELKRKPRSGDVCGVIGESCLAYYLTEEIRLGEHMLEHLGHSTRLGFMTPDFIIWDESNSLKEFIGENYEAPLLAEVKTTMREPSWRTIERGFQQLQFRMNPERKHGLLVLLSRNPDHSNFDMRIVGVKS
jgi:hypothetical protein